MARKTASDFFDQNDTSLVEEKQQDITPFTEDENEVNSVPSEQSEVKKDDCEKESDSEQDDKETISSEIIAPTVTPSAPQSQSQEEYMKQYQQYIQQYQQYYAQYYCTNNSVPVASDPAYEYFTGTSAGTVPPPAASFDASRASRQMTAYFDPNKFQAALSPEMLAAQRAQKEQQQSKLTAKEIEAFKKKRIEKKKAKNRWFYE